MAYTTINKSTDYFRTKTFTGNATNNTAITWDESSNMQPDFLWFKNRSQGQSNALFDIIRGADKRLISNSTGAEGTEATNLDSFDTNGFTVDYEAIVNGNNDNMVTWGWKANGAGSANTAGSINTTYTSVNTTAGFSISSYTGNGSAGATVGHGLGAVPKVIIVKRLNASGGWVVYNEALGNTKIMELHDTSASQTSSAAWNNTSPSSTTFTLGDYTSTNTSGGTYIAYCFAEKTGYSKFGSYTGNGNADGPFVYTGFKPAFVIVKRTDAVHDWRMHDAVRNPNNVIGKYLEANTSDVEGDSVNLDFISNGFKLRTTTGAHNASGGNYIYMAFAEAPLVGSNNVPCTAR